MFIGHYGLALASKRLSKKTSLGSLTFAAQLADMLWPVLLIAGVEEVRIVPEAAPNLQLDFMHYPISHSLLGGLLGGLLVGAIYWALRRDTRGALVMGALVPSHWFLDLPFHVADLPVWPGGPKVGFGLWQSVPVTLLCEFGLLGLGLWIYLRTTRARDGIGRWALWAYVAVLVGIYASTFFGPPPPSATALAWSGLILWVFVPWASWIDRHREVSGEHA